MRSASRSRKLHKWLGLFVGIQALLWMASGLYMTAVSIDIIHGDHLAHGAAPALAFEGTLADPAVLAQAFPALTTIRLRQAGARPVYEIAHPGGTAFLDAVTGKPVAPLARDHIAALARAAYHGDAAIASLALLDSAPSELGGRPAPLWRANFDDLAGTSLYFAPVTGDLLGKRHDLWRVFDFLWMLHIMDYDTREDINNLLLRVASALGLLFALSGGWLLFYTLRVKAPQ